MAFAVIVAALAGCSRSVSGQGTGPREKLTCPAGVVPGVPFCYPIPAGFTNDRGHRPASGWTYYTLVSVGQHDLIQVAAASIGVDTDADNDAALAKLAESQRMRPGKLNTATASPFSTLVVDGARAFSQTLTYVSGVGARQIEIYRGRTLVQISCQYEAKRAVVEKGCTDVIGTIQVVGLPH